MKEFISKRRIVFVTIIVILLVITSLYATYAIDVFVNDATPSEYDMAFNFQLSSNTNKQLSVAANETKIFDMEIINPYNDAVNYGVAYSMVNPTTLPSGVTIAQASISSNPSVGSVNANTSVNVSIIVVNESTSNITLSFSVINGYKNGGELIVPTGNTLVEEEYQIGPMQYTKIDNSNANAPAYAENLVPVMYDGTNWVTADVKSSTSTYGWYDYDAKKWANAVLLTETKRNSLEKKGNYYTPGQTIGDTESAGVLAFYVWIPRYKYKVWNINKVIATDTYSAQTKGIDIAFEEGEASTGGITCKYDFSKTATETVRNEDCTNSGDGYYTHPAFTFGNDELTGFWMGKFELSSSSPGTTNGGSTSVTLTPRILPNVTSWRDNYVESFWKVMKDMQKANNIYGLITDTTKVDTHMLTNMEWGAVAYLTHSKYGRCTGGTSSTCTQVMGANSYITGYLNVDYQLASTTGNIYGVYDMSGGAREQVMGNVSSSNGSYGYNVKSAAGGGTYYTYSGNEKYLTTYAYGTSGTDQTAGNRVKLGDATSEVAKGKGMGWYDDDYVFMDSSSPWVTRDGVGTAGMFSFQGNSGTRGSGDSSRAALSILTS